MYECYTPLGYILTYPIDSHTLSSVPTDDAL